jgi:hypothetical protein
MVGRSSKNQDERSMKNALIIFFGQMELATAAYSEPISFREAKKSHIT